MLLLGTATAFRDHVLEVCPEFARFSSNAEGIRRSFEGSSLETIKHMVAAGMGVTLVPRLGVPPGSAGRPIAPPQGCRQPYVSYIPITRRAWGRRRPHAASCWPGGAALPATRPSPRLRNAIYACELPGVTRLS
jgi:LysR family hydrogen peroxide-inducible transcriptional activator